MDTSPATLHLLCGKIAAGKSTLCAELAAAPNTVVIAEDAWLAMLYGDRMKTGADFMHFCARLRAALTDHIAALLRSGLSVVLDFAANTRGQRAWMREVIAASGAVHQLHFLDVPDEVCLARLRARNASGAHPFAATEEQFRRFSAHFEAPAADEGFEIVRHG